MKQFPLSEKNLTYAYKEEMNAYNWLNQVGPVKGFIFGSSTLKYGLSATGLMNSDSLWVNFSEDARDPVVSYFLLKKYFYLKKPSIILLGLDAPIYSKTYYVHRDKIMYLDLNSAEMMTLYKQDKSIFFTKFKQLFLYTFPGKSKNNPESKNVVPPDFGSVVLKRYPIDFEKEKLVWKEGNQFLWSSIEFDYLNRIKDFCHANNVKLIFLLSPKIKQYAEFIKAESANEYLSWWHKINETIGGEYILGSYSCMQAYNQDSVFADEYHLNEKGQHEFSVFIKNHLNIPESISPNYKLF